MNRNQLADSILGLIPLIHRKLIKKHWGHADITRQQIGLLHILSHHNGNPINFYSEKMCISKPNMTKLINQLIEKKYVTRNNDISDRRVINLYITDEGKNILKENYNKLREQAMESLTPLTDEEISILLHNFEQIKEILEKLENNGSCGGKL